MRTKTNTRRTTACALPRDPRAETILEFVFNDEEEALCREDFVLSQQREIPAVEEFLQEMAELDSLSATGRWH